MWVGQQKKVEMAAVQKYITIWYPGASGQLSSTPRAYPYFSFFIHSWGEFNKTFTRVIYKCIYCSQTLKQWLQL